MSATHKRGKPEKAEIGHGAISHRRLDSIFPSPLNNKLYRPVLAADPDVIALAESIRDKGVLDPLVISRDGFIISGHRRHKGAELAGLKIVPCIVKDVRHGDPEFLVLLREYNRNRVKSLDEVIREEIVTTNPKQAHRFLQEQRKEASRVSLDTITIEGTKTRARITKAKQPFLDAIRKILREQSEFLPLTDRSIHYALLNDPPLVHASKPNSRYANTLRCYKATCELITRARLAGLIPFAAIHDPTRPVESWNFHRSVGPFIRKDVRDFLSGYYRDLQQSQPNQIEIVGEKNTIESIIRPLALEYCIPMTIGRGYCSLPPRCAMARRFQASGKEKLVVLILSDFDPEGEDIAHSFARSMRDDFGIGNVEAIKVALTAQQVIEMQLPPRMKVKEASSRAAKFTDRHGDNVFELEAVQPGRMQRTLRGAIDSIIDIDLYNAELAAEEKDAAKLEGVRKSLARVIEDSIKDMEGGDDEP